MSNGPADVISVFITHKHEDEKAARSIKEMLKVISGSRADFFISEEIQPGKDWFEAIRESIAKSQLLIFLYTDPTNTWDWPLLEAGMFLRLEGEDRPIILLHNPKSEPPPQLQRFQSVKAEPDNVKEMFLKKLFGSSELTGVESPINEAFASSEAELNRVANEICDLISSPTERKYYILYLCFRVDPKLLNEGRIPDETAVTSNSESFEALFGLEERPPGGDSWTWGKLIESISEPEEQRWIERLGEAFQRAAQKKVIDPIDATFKAKNGRIYRPVVHIRDEKFGGSLMVEFVVLFVEELSGLEQP